LNSICLSRCLRTFFQMNPPAAVRHGLSDYESLPALHALLNQHIANQQVVLVP
jgi:hypothetical protein